MLGQPGELDPELTGTAWPTLNPDYRLNPSATINMIPTDRLFDSVYHENLTPEFLIRECIKRGWQDISGRLRWFAEDEDQYTAECRIGDEWAVYSVPRDAIDANPGGAMDGSVS